MGAFSELWSKTSRLCSPNVGGDGDSAGALKQRSPLKGGEWREDQSATTSQTDKRGARFVSFFLVVLKVIMQIRRSPISWCWCF